ncbi:MAG: hypothetical protein LBL41_03555 [Bifidobacteriaceae bacterium]|nr:hypothetical protein [Bifidobacteriaceae bacterium]
MILNGRIVIIDMLCTMLSKNRLSPSRTFNFVLALKQTLALLAILVARANVIVTENVLVETGRFRV